MAELEVDSVLVTGCNRGIGLELVKQLAQSGKRPKWIFASCRDPEGPRAQDLRNLASKHQGVKIIPLDVCEPSTIKAAVLRVTEQLEGNGLNLLINNAGIVKGNKTLDAETAEDMLEAYRTNVVGPLLVTKAFLPLLKKASQESPQQGMSCNRAAVINISSDAGSITNVLGWECGAVPNYRCSKAALNMLTRCQALSYAEDKILCVALHPGWLQTEMGNTEGFQAPMTVEDGVRSILNRMTCLSEKENGGFLGWDGKVLPY